MKKNLLIYLVLSFLNLTLCYCQDLKQYSTSKESINRFRKTVDSIIIGKMNNYNIPGLAIGLVANDTVIYRKGFGVKNIDSHHPITENSIFHTASISKLFTAQAIMMLVEKGQLSLDEKLTDIIPELNYKDKSIEDITIKSLLNHTSGLPDVVNYHWRKNNQSPKSLEKYVLALNLKPKHEPLATYGYSNLGYNILGYVLERVTNTSFDLYLKENILNESAMNNSDFRYFKIPDTLKVSPHSQKWTTKKVYKRKVYPYTREQAPSSTLNSSVKDLSKWMITFLKLNSQASSDNIYSEMLKPSFSAYPYIGLGFKLSKINSKMTVGHYGGDKGFRSYLIMFPKEQIGLVILANCDYNEDFRQEILHPIAKLMLTRYSKYQSK